MPLVSSYCLNLAFDTSTDIDWGVDPRMIFRKITDVPHGGTDTIVFGDGIWRETQPDNNAVVPPDMMSGGWGTSSFYGVQRMCLDRHQKAVNIAFADGHVDRERLPDLWKLTWSPISQPMNVTAQFPPGYQ